MADGSLISLDKTKLDRSKAAQLLRESPNAVRERFQLPAPQPRAKRARLTGASRDNPPLQLEEFAGAFRELSGREMTEDELLKLMGNTAYADDLEGTVHPIDPSTLPQEPLIRLKRLFELQSHWRPEHLAGLLAPVMFKDQKVDPWLMKYARTVHLELQKGTEKMMMVKKFGGL
mmetsp:Transcript_54652/g.122921  ORF Transcript_54652/g.122921 Transcript_54652/m.122921 type:complete len:174 (+) Transcript_54652:1-522(+)